MRTVHLVYPHGPAISCPDAIGRHLAEHLEARYEVRLYDWKDTGSIRPGTGDVLLGHPHPSPFTIFRRSAKREGWARRLAMFPFNHADLGQIAFADGTVRRCDLVLAITGNHWFETVEGSPAGSWLPKLRHLDLAVDRSEFPRIKTSFGASGQRRFLYIGHSGWQKNPGYLSAIASELPSGKLSWGGRGDPIEGLDPLGEMDFADAAALEAVRAFDFTITVGKADANPATILESMAWGLIPVCTPESGYKDVAGIVNVPLDDPAGVAAILTGLDEADEATLTALRDANDEALDRHFDWERFAADVCSAIESSDSPSLGKRTAKESLEWKLASIGSRYSVWRPANLARAVIQLLRTKSAS